MEREIKEDVGVEVELIILLPLAGSSTWQHPDVKEHAILLCWLCRIKSGTVMVDGKEAINYRWATLEELENIPLIPLAKEFAFLADEYLKKSQ